MTTAAATYRVHHSNRDLGLTNETVPCFNISAHKRYDEKRQIDKRKKKGRHQKTRNVSPLGNPSKPRPSVLEIKQ